MTRYGRYRIHDREADYKHLVPGDKAYYDRLIHIDLSTVEPMIALPYHPSNAFPLKDVIARPEKYMKYVEDNAKTVFENNPDIHPDMLSKIQKNGRIRVDQAAIAGCAAGSFENISYVDQVAKAENRGLGMFPLNIYPASQPVLTELNKDGIVNDLMTEGVRVKTAFCGPASVPVTARKTMPSCCAIPPGTIRTEKAPNPTWAGGFRCSDGFQEHCGHGLQRWLSDLRRGNQGRVQTGRHPGVHVQQENL